MVTVEEIGIRDPFAGVDDRGVVLPAQIPQERLHAGPGPRRIPAAELTPLRHYHEGRGDPLAAADLQHLAQGLAGIPAHLKTREIWGVLPPCLLDAAANLLRGDAGTGRRG